MSDHGATATAQEQVMPRPDRAPARPSFWLSVPALWLREVRGFYRQRARVIAGIATPLIFWAVLGAGFGSSLQSGGAGYSVQIAGRELPGALDLRDVVRTTREPDRE